MPLQHAVLTVRIRLQRHRPAGVGNLHPPVSPSTAFVNNLILEGCPVTLLRCTDGTFNGASLLTTAKLPLRLALARPIFLPRVTGKILCTVVTTRLWTGFLPRTLWKAFLPITSIRPMLIPSTNPVYTWRRTLVLIMRGKFALLKNVVIVLKCARPLGVLTLTCSLLTRIDPILPLACSVLTFRVM